MGDPITSVLLSYGPAGVIILILLLVIRHLYKQNQEIQEKRIAEGLSGQANNLKTIEALMRFEQFIRDKFAGGKRA